MLRYALKRLLLLVPVLWGVATAVFFVMRLLPGDPVDWMLGERADLGSREALRTQLGLNVPVYHQYKDFLLGALHFDFGRSFVSGKPVLLLIAERLPATLALGGAALFLALLVSFPIGILAGAFREKSGGDRAVFGATLLGISIPSFWLGPLLILLFAIHWGVLPASGNATWSAVILPALTLSTAMIAFNIRMIRAALHEILHEDFLRTARAKGVSETAILLRHALRNALLPVVTIFGLQCGILLSGAIVTEKIFSWPGMGSLLIQAIEQRDFAVVQTCVLLFAAGYVLINLAADLINAFLDPRLRQSLAGEA